MRLVLLSSTQPDCEEFDDALPFWAQASTPFIMPDIQGGNFTLRGKKRVYYSEIICILVQGVHSYLCRCTTVHPLFCQYYYLLPIKCILKGAHDLLDDSYITTLEFYINTGNQTLQNNIISKIYLNLCIAYNRLFEYRDNTYG